MCVKAALRTPGCDLLFVCVVYCVMCALLWVNGGAAATVFHNYGVERRLKCVRRAPAMQKLGSGKNTAITVRPL